MKKFIRNVIIIALTVVLFIIFFPVKRRLFYQQLTEDCSNHGIWIHDRIFCNRKPIDIAFIGASRTLCGIRDKLIEQKLNHKLNVANFGYCRFGDDLSFVFLKEIIKTKKIKTLVFEVREDAERYSHPIFPYIAETSDVLFAPPLFNRDFFIDYCRHFCYKLKIIQDIVFNKIENIQLQTDDYGYALHSDTATVESLNEKEEKHRIKRGELTKLERDFHSKFSRSYLKKINQICKQECIKIYFLYIPEYGTNIEKPKEFETYVKYGQVLIPPKAIFEKKTNWHDDSHLNLTGATELSTWIACFLNK
jgi:hypothetical protein